MAGVRKRILGTRQNENSSQSPKRSCDEDSASSLPTLQSTSSSPKYLSADETNTIKVTYFEQEKVEEQVDVTEHQEKYYYRFLHGPDNLEQKAIANPTYELSNPWRNKEFWTHEDAEDFSKLFFFRLYVDDIKSYNIMTVKRDYDGNMASFFHWKARFTGKLLNDCLIKIKERLRDDDYDVIVGDSPFFDTEWERFYDHPSTVCFPELRIYLRLYMMTNDTRIYVRMFQKHLRTLTKKTKEGVSYPWDGNSLVLTTTEFFILVAKIKAHWERYRAICSMIKGCLTQTGVLGTTLLSKNDRQVGNKIASSFPPGEENFTPQLQQPIIGAPEE